MRVDTTRFEGGCRMVFSPARNAQPTTLPQDSPWGEVQTATVLATGIVFVDTAGHGGIKLSPERIAQMPEGARKRSGWYEEDCESLWPFHRFWDELDHAKFWGNDPEKIEKARKAVEAGIARYENDFSRVRMNT